MRRLPLLLLFLLIPGCSPASGLRWEDSPVTPRGPAPDILARGPTWFRFRIEKELVLEVPGTRTMALFPGLEFLEGKEFSSSDRDVRGPLADRRRPDPSQVTVPLMAVEVGGTLVALLWKGGGRPYFEARESTRMGLAPQGGPLEAVLVVEPGATVLDAVPRWLAHFGGLPVPEPWPRTLDEELRLCKAG
ncbi:MAG TPA: hypothetical protein VKW04_18360, partial [Planctomycetota bacterium]|nr:hypothetical protein [Planctomycetota bacterium]